MSVIIIKVPSLNERIEDIAALADKFLEDIAEEYGSKKKLIAPAAIAGLKQSITGQAISGN